nr:unnamed protein product [Callosobruchus analis]
MERQFQEMLAEPSNEFHNLYRMSFTDFELRLQKVDPIIPKKNTNGFDLSNPFYVTKIALQ